MNDSEMRRRVRASVAERQAAGLAVDEREGVALAEFLDAFDGLDDPLSQEADIVHVTGSSLVVGPRGVILLKHKRLGFWLQPGGHIDPGESPWVAALRETVEETGLASSFVGPLDADGMPPLMHVDVHAGGRGHTHLDLRYLIDGGEADPSPPEGESQEIDWFDWEAAVERADPGLEGILRHLQSR